MIDGLDEGVSATVGPAVRTGAAAIGFGKFLAWTPVRKGTRPSVSIDRWSGLVGSANTGYVLAYHVTLVRAPVVVITPVSGLSTLFVVGGAAALLREPEGVICRLPA